MFFRRRNRLQQLKDRAWLARPVPAACGDVQTMLIPDELRLLDFLADDYYQQDGVIVDAGCFLGGSTLALANGLTRNLSRRRRPASKLIHSFDLFQVEDWTRGIYFPKDVEAGVGTRAIYDRNIANYAPLIDIHEGDITHSRWSGAPIEILFIDVAKHWTVCDWITENLFPHLIPGKSIVVQQDYLYHYWNGWLHVTMEHYRDNFEILCDTEYNSVAFLYKKRFEPGAIKPALVGSMPIDDKAALMDRAAARFSGQKKEWLQSSKAHFIEMASHGG